VRGNAEAVVPLVHEVLPQVGDTYRPLGDPGLITAIVAGVPGLVPGTSFGWMQGRRLDPPPGISGPGGHHGGAPASEPARPPVRWLVDTELGEATELLQAASPSSDAMPGVPGVECWAGIRDDDGRLAALAALAWSAPAVGLIAGVAVGPGARRRGLGGRVCRFVLNAALDRHGNAALMVEESNSPAIRLYRRLGLRYRPVLSARTPP
jgi:GNAT superfamily N-acetyltransferase